MDFFFPTNSKSRLQATGTAATPRGQFCDAQKPGTSVTSADEPEVVAQGCRIYSWEQGYCIQTFVEFETLHKEKAQEAAEAKSPSQKKADQEAAEARKKEAGTRSCSCKKKADDDTARKRRRPTRNSPHRGPRTTRLRRAKRYSPAAAEKARRNGCRGEAKSRRRSSRRGEKGGCGEAAAEQLKATEKAYSFANLLIVLDEVANIPCKKKLQNVPDVHSVAELLEAIVEQLKDDFEQLGLRTDVNAKQSSSKHPRTRCNTLIETSTVHGARRLGSLNTRKDRVMVTFASPYRRHTRTRRRRQWW